MRMATVLRLPPCSGYDTHTFPNETRPMNATTIRDEARRLVEQLPDDATWDDLLYDIYVRQSVEAGLADCRAGPYLSSPGDSAART